MRSRILLLSAAVLLLGSCGNGNSDQSTVSEAAAANDYLASADSTSFAAGLQSLSSPSRKFIRTADVRARVTDVYSATTQLETLTLLLGGIIQESKLSNEVASAKTIYYKPDSNLQTQTYTTTAHLTLRVPAAKLDTVLKVIPALSAFVDYRTLNQSDVTLNYLGNALRNAAMGNSSNAAALASKTKDAIQAAEYADQKAEEGITRKVENLHLLDEVNYATIIVAFYQPMQVSSLVTVNPEYVTAPSYGAELLHAFKSGLSFLRALSVFVLQLWAVWLLLGLGFYIYRRERRRRNASIQAAGR